MFYSHRAKSSIQKTSLKAAAEEFQDLCKRAQFLSNKGLLECLIIATLKKAPDEELLINEEAVVEEGHILNESEEDMSIFEIEINSKYLASQKNLFLW